MRRLLFAARHTRNLNWLWLLALLPALFILWNCAGDDDDNDDSGGDDDWIDSVDGLDTDDCGYPTVQVPAGCDSCHQSPPQTARHPRNHRCFRCHGYVIDQDMAWVQPELHNNGVVDVAVGCSSCHGWNQDTSPPQNLRGECGTEKKGVGSHAGMRRDPIQAHRVNCTNCHDVPNTTWEPGHIDGDMVAEVKFKNLATLKGANPIYDGTKCSGVYCHGATLQGGDYKEPLWGDESGKANQCGACHRLTDPQGNADVDCSSCHPSTLDSARTIYERGTHINGYIDMAGDDAKGGAQ